MTTEEHIKVIYDRLETLTSVMLGNKEFGTRGWRHRIERAENKLSNHDDRMDKIDKRFEKIYQRVVGICIGVTIATSAVGWVVQNSIIDVQARSVEHIESVEVPPTAIKPMLPPYYLGELNDDTVTTVNQ